MDTSLKKVLVIGDMHVVRNEIDECKNLMSYVQKLCYEHTPDYVVFMGDQTHNHAILDAYVMDFWSTQLRSLSAGLDEIAGHGGPDATIVLLAGNHDQANSKDVNSTTSMDFFAGYPRVRVVTQPWHKDRMLFLPYYHSNDLFLLQCHKYAQPIYSLDLPCSTFAQLETRMVFCHQSFNGARYENGFPIEDGTDANLVPQEKIVSGHIHNHADVGKLHYVGSPRWRGVLDSNQEKFIHLYTVDAREMVMVKDLRQFPTEHCVTKMVAFADREEEPLDDGVLHAAIDAGNAIVVDLYGTHDYISQRKKVIPSSVRIRTYPRAKTRTTAKESDGILVAFEKFVPQHTPTHGVDMTIVAAKAREVITRSLTK
jgi:DNA repair exonuclease SbcCD nuclease subunit